MYAISNRERDSIIATLGRLLGHVPAGAGTIRLANDCRIARQLVRALERKKQLNKK